MKTVIVHTDNYSGDIKVFSSSKTLLHYYQKRIPKATRLRVKEYPTFMQVLNHNAIVGYLNIDIERVEIDKEG